MMGIENRAQLRKDVTAKAQDVHTRTLCLVAPVIKDENYHRMRGGTLHRAGEGVDQAKLAESLRRLLFVRFWLSRAWTSQVG